MKSIILTERNYYALQLKIDTYIKNMDAEQIVSVSLAAYSYGEATYEKEYSALIVYKIKEVKP